MNPRLLSFKRKEVCSEIMRWWSGLQADPASRAALCRARGIHDVYGVRAYHQLRVNLKDHVDRLDDDKLAATALLIARVRYHDSSAPLGQRMGSSSRRTVVVSEIRFRGLYRAKNLPSLIKEASSIIGLLDCRANVLELAEAVYWWGGDVRKKLSREYYETLLVSNG